MKINSIDHIKMLPNKVLVKIEKQFNDEIKFADGKLLIDVSFEPERNTVTKGIVYKVCESLIFGKGAGMEWDTDIEIREGDEVYLSWMAVDAAFKTQSYFVTEDKGSGEGNKIQVYIIADYSYLTLCIRDQKVIMLNGYCLIEPLNNEDLPSVIKKKLSENIIIPNSVKKVSSVWGRVIKAGHPNKQYLSDVYYDDNIKEGDLVAFQKGSNVPLQYNMHADFMGKREFYKIQRRYILAYLPLFA